MLNKNLHLLNLSLIFSFCIHNNTHTTNNIILAGKRFYNHFFALSDEKLITQSKQFCANTTKNVKKIQRNYTHKEQLSDKSLKKHIRDQATQHPFIAYAEYIQKTLDTLNKYTQTITEQKKTVNVRKLKLNPANESFESLFAQFEEIENNHIERLIDAVRTLVLQHKKRVKSFQEYKDEKALQQIQTYCHNDEKNRWHVLHTDHETPFVEIAKTDSHQKESSPTSTTQQTPASDATSAKQPSFGEQVFEKIHKVDKFIKEHGGNEILKHQKEYHSDWFNVN